MKFFVYDEASGGVKLKEESLLLIKEFADLINRKKGKLNKERTFKEFTFIYLYFDWESPYLQHTEAETYQETVKDSKLTEEELKDPLFRAACKKYQTMQDSSKVGKLLMTSYNAIDKITHYLDNIDLEERDPMTGRPIFKTKDVIAEISSASKLIEAVKTLELQYKKDGEVDSALRGDRDIGMFDRFGTGV